MVKLVCGAAAALALVACSSSASEGSPVVASPAAPVTASITADPDAPAGETSRGIVKIQARDRSITLLAGHGGRLVTIEDDHGRIIAKEVDVDTLQAIDARAYELVRSTVAGGRGSADLFGN